MTKQTQQYRNHNNIAILGAGIMGLMTAYMLVKAQNEQKASAFPITLYDPKGFPAQNASALAGGMLAPYSEIEHMDMEWVKAGLAGIEQWRDTQLETGFSRRGSLLIAHPQDEYILERFAKHLPQEIQTYQNVKDIEKQIDKKFKQGVFLQEEAHLNPLKTIHSLYESLRKSIDFDQSAKTPDDFSKTDTIVIDCRGMGTKDKNLRGVKGETLLVRNPDFSLERPVRIMHPRYPLYIIPRDNHVFMIGATIIESGENTDVSLRSSMELMSALYTLSPSFGEADIIELKAGIRPSYPDNLPRITLKNNVITCNGLFRHGFLLSPVMAECVKDHIIGEDNVFSALLIKGGKDENHHQRAA